jgi:hypothetical protein
LLRRSVMSRVRASHRSRPGTVQTTNSVVGRRLGTRCGSRGILHLRTVICLRTCCRSGDGQCESDAASTDQNRCQHHFTLFIVRGCANSNAAECLAGMVHDGRFAGVVVGLGHAVHGVVCVGTHPEHTSDSAMADGAAVMPRHFGADRDCLECLLCSSHIISPPSPSTCIFPATSHRERGSSVNHARVAAQGRKS